MYALRYLTAIVVLAAAGCAGRDGLPDSRTLPLRLEEVREVGRSVAAGDLDGDGYDELVDYGVELDWRPEGMRALKLYDSRHMVIDQLNYQGRLLVPEFLDTNGDGIRELLVPFVRHDSLFISGVDRRGTKRFGFFLTAGEPRQEPDGIIPWDPDVDVSAADVDGDGDRELIVHIVTAYARYPRGVAVFDLPGGTLIGSHFTGAKMLPGHSGDFDGDGHFEIAFAAWATRSGADAGGFDDDHAYLMVYEFQPEPVLTWSREVAGRWTKPTFSAVELDGDARPEFYLCTASANRAAQIEVIAPGTWRVRQQRVIDEPLDWCQVLDVDGDARTESVFLRGNDEIWLIDEHLDVIRTAKLPVAVERISLLRDIDGDGTWEIVAFVREGGPTLVLGADLNVRAVWSGHLQERVRCGVGRSPHLLGRRDGITYALEPVANPFYWAYRYGPWAGAIVAALILITAAVVGYRHVWKARLNEELYARVFAEGRTTHLVVDSRGRIIESNERARVLLNREAGRREELEPASPLGQFVHSCVEREPAQRCERDVAGLGPDASEAHVTVEPLALSRLGSRVWLVTVDFGAVRQRHSDVSIMMAQRVAHDIKNPLTSILLTLQRLQMEYQERAPALAESLDPYTERIVERIAQLRRMTRNFMKVVDQEEPSFKTLDLSRWLEERAGLVRQALPPDIDLVQQIEEAPPPVRADPDQLEEVLTNLVTNGVEAMPEGGTLTLSTGLAYGLLLPGANAPRDYAILEVMDTGVGLSEEDRDRIFAPGFTRFENGTGLGLALVRKIVDDHEGYVEVDGEPGVGSAFTIYLPVAEPPR